jgi:hypothetical protein
MRENLEAVNGMRMRFTAVVERFGSKTNWHGYPESTILLKDVRFVDTGQLACDHLWFRHGNWALGLVEGHKFAFDARVDSYAKGYQGAKADRLGMSSYSVDYHLERPTRVEILDEEVGTTD